MRYSIQIDKTVVLINMFSERTILFHEIKKTVQSISEKIGIVRFKHDVEKIVFKGNDYCKDVYNIIQYEMRDVIGNVEIEFLKKEEGKMKLFYINEMLYCGNRDSTKCENGLSIETNCPLDTVFHFRREDGEEMEAVQKNGIVNVPDEFIVRGVYSIEVYAVKPGGIPTNTVRIEIETGKKGKFASCIVDFDELLAYFACLVEDYYEMSKKLSDHIDGYEVI